MSILQSRMGGCEEPCVSELKPDTRFERDTLGDLKHGLDLIFELKTQLDKLHPIASETLIRLLSH
jgi:hypothetical protein